MAILDDFFILYSLLSFLFYVSLDSCLLILDSKKKRIQNELNPPYKI